MSGYPEAVLHVSGRPLVPVVEQVEVFADHRVALLGEPPGDVGVHGRLLHGIQGTEQSQHPHVLALARIVGMLAALLVDGNFNQPILARSEVLEGGGVAASDFLVGMLGPGAVDQNDSSGL